LVKKGIRNEISLLGSGGINLAEHVVKAMICGLDCVGINSVVHLALQSKIEIKNGKIVFKPRKIELDWGKQRLMNILAAWHEQIIEALSAMGKRDVRRLRGDVGRAIFYEEIRKEAFADIKKAF
jgi:glutamate synthase domain-containing protein 2